MIPPREGGEQCMREFDCRVRLAPIRRTNISGGTWSVEVTVGSPLILHRECGAVYPVGVVVNLIAAAGSGNGTRTGWMGLVAAIRPLRANGGMVPEGDTKAPQQFA